MQRGAGVVATQEDRSRAGDVLQALECVMGDDHVDAADQQIDTVPGAACCFNPTLDDIRVWRANRGENMNRALAAALAATPLSRNIVRRMSNWRR
jgi:hypothetical protein